MGGNGITLFISFGVGHIPKDIEKIIGNKDIATNIYRTQAYDSIIFCEYFCVFMIRSKSLTDFTNRLNNFKNNDKVILNYICKKLYIYAKKRSEEC